MEAAGASNPGHTARAAREMRRPTMNLNVLVLGGTQFMGRLMVEHLLASGHRVTMSNRGVTANPFGEHISLLLNARRP
jgi:nucleoside-diphosphate-sugar epimerase